MSVSASAVKELREKTNAGMMDCKKALEETQGDFEAAVEWLRKKGLASAAKKSDRLASEGLVTAMSNGTSGVVVEINSETDFVSRNDAFKSFVNDIAQHAMTTKESGEILDQKFMKNPSTTVGEAVKETIAKIGENLVVRRAQKFELTGNGFINTYVHGEGKIGVMLELTASTPAAATSPETKTVAQDICLHIAAMNPLSISSEQMDQNLVNKEKEILKAKGLEQGKKAEMIDKIVEGQIRKFLAENCLVDQAYVKNPDLKISDYLKEAGKKAGGDLTIKRFVRYELGEGLEKKSNDFAAEVAAQTKGH